MQTTPMLNEDEWVNSVYWKPQEKDLKRARDFLLKPGRKDAMFSAIQDYKKLFRRANAFAAAGFDVRNIVKQKIITISRGSYYQVYIEKWENDFNIIENKIRLKKLVMLFPDDLCVD